MAPVPIYQYRDGMGFLRFFYTPQSQMDGVSSINSVPQDDLQNWSYNHPDPPGSVLCPAFYGCEASDPGAVPVYQYQAPANVPGQPADACMYVYTLNPGQYQGWTLSGPASPPTPAFYVYGGPDAGLAEYAWWFLVPSVGAIAWSYFLGCYVPETAASSIFFSPPANWGGPFLLNNGQGQEFQPIYALPGAVQLGYAIQNIRLLPFPHNPSPKLVGREHITNNSSTATIDQNVSYQMVLDTSYTLSLTETLSASVTQGVEVSLPGLGGASAQLTLEVDLSSTQSITKDSQQSVQIDTTVTVPPNLSVTVNGLVNVVSNAQIPVEIVLLVTATANGVTLPAPVGSPCSALTELFLQQNPSFTNSSDITPVPQLSAIQVLLKGILTSTFGVSTETVVIDNPNTSAGVERVKLAEAKIYQ